MGDPSMFSPSPTSRAHLSELTADRGTRVRTLLVSAGGDPSSCCADDQTERKVSNAKGVAGSIACAS